MQAKMDETYSNYGTTAEVEITLIAEDGTEKTFKLPEAKDSNSIQAAAIGFGNLATSSDSAIIGVNSTNGLVVPTKIRIDLVETTRTAIYSK